jgi:hypothetical protein
VLPLWTTQEEGRDAEGGHPVDTPEWEGTGGGGGGGGEETVTTAVGEDISTCVDPADGGCEEGEVEGEGSPVSVGSGALIWTERWGCGDEGGGVRERGREGEVAMSTSSGGEEGLMEEVVECWSLMEEGGTAGTWRGVMEERVRMVNEGRGVDRTVARGGVGGVGGRRTRRGVSEGSTSTSTVTRSLLTPHSSYETATWREEMNEWRGTASARWRDERKEFMLVWVWGGG